MNLATIIGIAVGVTAVIAGQVLEGGHISSIFHLTAGVIVFGGTFGAVLVQYPMSVVSLALRMAAGSLVEKDIDMRRTIAEIASFVRIARKEGVLALEPKIREHEDYFFRKGLQLVVDGVGIEDIKEIMTIEMACEEERKIEASKVFESAGGYAPTLGILGAVLGLISVMENLADPSALGHGIAVAFVATVYGVGSANLFWLPFAGKLRLKTRHDTLKKELMIEGIVSLSRGENPRLICERLEGFLTRKERGNLE
ncbi:MAG: flagellar motor protein [Deltaproteobacteria bacterium]|nr:flagellar motor protein [Deltaproteobacteria bacterium]